MIAVTVTGDLAGEVGVEPTVQIIAARCSRLSLVGGRAPARSLNKHSFTTARGCPVPRYLVAFVIDVVFDLSCTVASGAEALLPWVCACSAALRADDHVVIFVHGLRPPLLIPQRRQSTSLY